ncbi:speckle-type POZ protein B-like [Cotesia typhae]|uniref:speckle-type POZ protein B-like n=1 Tax=Cotesia typhae TaxID=2053667 RepID=UPI003D683AFA
MSDNIKKKRGYTIVKKHTVVYEWMINEISSYINSSSNSKESESLFSPQFSADSHVQDLWQLHLKFNGQLTEEKNYLSIFLRSLNTQRIIKTKAVYFIVTNKRERVNVYKFSKVYDAHQSLGYVKFILKSELLEKKKELAPYDTLTLGVELTVFDDYWTISTSPPFDHTKRLITSDLKDLFETKMDTDVTFIVGEKKFPAHKLVLMVRSPVFRAMLSSSKEHEINIPDTCPDMFDKLLEFIYTDRVADLDAVAEDLVELADKYQVRTLKQVCFEELCMSVNIENAARMILLADRLNAEIMFKYVTEYIRINAETVIQTEGYKLMETANPFLALMIFKNFSALKIEDKPAGPSNKTDA